MAHRIEVVPIIIVHYRSGLSGFRVQRIDPWAIGCIAKGTISTCSCKINETITIARTSGSIYWGIGRFG